MAHPVSATARQVPSNSGFDIVLLSSGPILQAAIVASNFRSRLTLQHTSDCQSLRSDHMGLRPFIKWRGVCEICGGRRRVPDTEMVPEVGVESIG